MERAEKGICPGRCHFLKKQTLLKRRGTEGVKEDTGVGASRDLIEIFSRKATCDGGKRRPADAVFPEELSKLHLSFAFAAGGPVVFGGRVYVKKGGGVGGEAPPEAGTSFGEMQARQT